LQALEVEETGFGVTVMLTRLDLVLYGVSRPTIPETRYPVPGTLSKGCLISAS